MKGKRIPREFTKFLEDKGVYIETKLVSKDRRKYRLIKKVGMDTYKTLTDFTEMEWLRKKLEFFFMLRGEIGDS